jgi:hypothetical protein
MYRYQMILERDQGEQVVNALITALNIVSFTTFGWTEHGAPIVPRAHIAFAIPLSLVL